MAFVVNIAVLVALNATFLYLVWRYDVRLMAWFELKLVQVVLKERQCGYLQEIHEVMRMEELRNKVLAKRQKVEGTAVL